MATLYNADPNTGKYLEGRDTEAQENPMYNPETHKKIDRYLYNPRTSSLIPPPAASENKIPKLVDGNWVLTPDYRGRIFFDTQTGAKCEITEIGVIPDSSWTTKTPIKFSKWNSASKEWETDLEQLKVSRKLEAEKTAKVKRNGGFEWNGVFLDTDAATRSALKQAYDEIQADNEMFFDWKKSDGKWITLDNSNAQAVKDAVRIYIQQLFTAERKACGEIDALTATEAVEAYVIKI